MPGIALAVAAALVAYTVVSGPTPIATASRTPPADRASGLDEHEVQTANGVFSFRCVGSDLVVRRVGASVGLNASIFDDAKTSGTKQHSACLVIG